MTVELGGANFLSYAYFEGLLMTVEIVVIYSRFFSLISRVLMNPQNNLVEIEQVFCSASRYCGMKIKPKLEPK